MKTAEVESGKEKGVESGPQTGAKNRGQANKPQALPRLNFPCPTFPPRGGGDTAAVGTASSSHSPTLLGTELGTTQSWDQTWTTWQNAACLAPSQATLSVGCVFFCQRAVPLPL